MMQEPTIYVVSDSVGETAELVTKAAISQFPTPLVDIKRYAYVEDFDHIEDVLSLAKLHTSMIAFTLVKPEMRAYLMKRAQEENVLAYDIMGPLMDGFSKLFNTEPLCEPGMVHRLDDDYFKKVEAIEFAVKYDDGRDPRGLAKADIVLIGVSRTSKTPLSQYLALKRLKVANVPIVPEVDPPEQLYNLPKEKCFGLMIQPEKLNDIRRERLRALGLSDSASYATIKRINEEMEYFKTIAAKLDCQLIDVTNKAVEETANLILQRYQQLHQHR